MTVQLRTNVQAAPAREREHAREEVRHGRKHEHDSVHGGAGGADGAELDRADGPGRWCEPTHAERVERGLDAALGVVDDAGHVRRP